MLEKKRSNYEGERENVIKCVTFFSQQNAHAYNNYTQTIMLSSFDPIMGPNPIQFSQLK